MNTTNKTYTKNVIKNKNLRLKSQIIRFNKGQTTKPEKSKLYVEILSNKFKNLKSKFVPMSSNKSSLLQDLRKRQQLINYINYLIKINPSVPGSGVKFQGQGRGSNSFKNRKYRHLPDPRLTSALAYFNEYKAKKADKLNLVNPMVFTTSPQLQNLDFNIDKSTPSLPTPFKGQKGTVENIQNNISNQQPLIITNIAHTSFDKRALRLKNYINSLTSSPITSIPNDLYEQRENNINLTPAPYLLRGEGVGASLQLPALRSARGEAITESKKFNNIWDNLKGRKLSGYMLNKKYDNNYNNIIDIKRFSPSAVKTSPGALPTLTHKVSSPFFSEVKKEIPSTLKEPKANIKSSELDKSFGKIKDKNYSGLSPLTPLHKSGAQFLRTLNYQDKNGNFDSKNFNSYLIEKINQTTITKRKELKNLNLKNSLKIKNYIRNLTRFNTELIKDKNLFFLFNKSKATAIIKSLPLKIATKLMIATFHSIGFYISKPKFYILNNDNHASNLELNNLNFNSSVKETNNRKIIIKLFFYVNRKLNFIKTPSLAQNSQIFPTLKINSESGEGFAPPLSQTGDAASLLRGRQDTIGNLGKFNSNINVKPFLQDLLKINPKSLISTVYNSKLNNLESHAQELQIIDSNKEQKAASSQFGLLAKTKIKFNDPNPYFLFSIKKKNSPFYFNFLQITKAGFLFSPFYNYSRSNYNRITDINSLKSSIIKLTKLNLVAPTFPLAVLSSDEKAKIGYNDLKRGLSNRNMIDNIFNRLDLVKTSDEGLNIKINNVPVSFNSQVNITFTKRLADGSKQAMPYGMELIGKTETKITSNIQQNNIKNLPSASDKLPSNYSVIGGSIGLPPRFVPQNSFENQIRGQILGVNLINISRLFWLTHIFTSLTQKIYLIQDLQPCLKADKTSSQGITSNSVNQKYNKTINLLKLFNSLSVDSSIKDTRPVPTFNSTYSGGGGVGASLQLPIKININKLLFYSKLTHKKSNIILSSDKKNIKKNLLFNLKLRKVIIKILNNKIQKMFERNILNLFAKKFLYLTQYLGKLLNAKIEFDLVRLNKPHYESNILAQFLSHWSFEKPHNTIRTRVFRKIILISTKHPKNRVIDNKKYFENTNDFLNLSSKNDTYEKLSDIANGLIFKEPQTDIDTKGAVEKSLISGIHLKLGGRTFKQKVIPRKTVKQSSKGTLDKRKALFLEKSTCTNKAKRGSFTYTVKLSHGYRRK